MCHVFASMKRIVGLQRDPPPPLLHTHHSSKSIGYNNTYRLRLRERVFGLVWRSAPGRACGQRAAECELHRGPALRHPMAVVVALLVQP